MSILSNPPTPKGVPTGTTVGGGIMSQMGQMNGMSQNLQMANPLGQITKGGINAPIVDKSALSSSMNDTTRLDNGYFSLPAGGADKALAASESQHVFNAPQGIGDITGKGRTGQQIGSGMGM